MPVLQPHIYSHPGYIDKITMDKISLSVHVGKKINILSIEIAAFTIFILLFNSYPNTWIAENMFQLSTLNFKIMNSLAYSLQPRFKFKPYRPGWICSWEFKQVAKTHPIMSNGSANILKIPNDMFLLSKSAWSWIFVICSFKSNVSLARNKWNFFMVLWDWV